MEWNIRQNFYSRNCLPYFSATHLQVKPLSGSNNAVSSKGVPFGGFLGWQCCVSLPPRLCILLPVLRSLARVTPQRTSTTALFDYNQRWSFHAQCVLPLATASFQRLLHRSGTVCQSQSGHRRRCKFSAARAFNRGGMETNCLQFR